MLFPKKYHAGLAIALTLVVTVFVVVYSLRNTTPGILRKTSLEVVSALETVVNMPLKGLRKIWVRYIFLVDLEKDNTRLKDENARLTRELIKYREGYLEDIRLQRLLKLKSEISYPSIVARVVGRNPSSIFKMILINRGEADGLHAGLPVLGVSGIVGRILETSWHVSRVLLINDENSNIDVLVQESRIHGILQGAASAGCILKYVTKTGTVKAGDVVVSSGLGGVFPKGLPLGVVKAAGSKGNDLFQRIIVAPFEDFTALEEVLVLLDLKDGRK